METIALFGGSGRTGLPFIERALKENYRIVALARNPSKISISHENLRVIEGDVLQEEDVDRCIKDADLVVSLIGHGKLSPPDLQVMATQYILDSMRKNGVNRIISLTGGGVRDWDNDEPKFPDKMVVFIMKNLAGKSVRNALLDAREHAEIIKEFEGDWTLVRGPMLTEDPPKNTYQVGYVGKVKGIKLTRTDLADFMVKEISEKKYHRKMPFVTNG